MKPQIPRGDININMFIENMLHGYAYHKIIMNGKNEAIDYIFLDVNKQFEELTGLLAKEIIGKRVTEVLPDIKDEEFNWIQHYGDVALNNKKSQFEHQFKGLNKSFSISAFSPHKNYFITLFNDITPRKLIEQKLKQSSDIVKNIQIGIYIYHLEDIDDDRTLRMVDANPITKVYTGVSSKKLIGRTLDENFPGLREKNIPQQFAQVVRSQKPIELEDVYYGDNRTIRSAFSAKAFPLPNNHVGVSFENITRRKIFERKVVDSQNFTNRILNTSPNIIYIYDLVKQSNIFSSKNIIESLGYTAEEIKTMDKDFFSLLLHPEDAELVKTHHQKLSNDSIGQIHELNYRMKNKKGDWMWLMSRDVVFQRAENGKATQILGTAVDISQRKKNEEKIKILEKFTESSTQGLAIAHLNKKLFYLNPALCGIIEEKDPQHVTGNGITNYIPDRIHEKFNNEVIPTVLKNGWWSGGSFIKTKSGREIPTFENIFLLKDEMGNPQFIAAIITDITEQKKIEKEIDEYKNNLETLVEKRTAELKVSEEKFKALFYENHSVILLIESDTGEIADANQAACEYYKYSYEQITKMNIKQINTLSEKEIELELENAKKLKRGHFTFKHKLANNDIRDVEVYTGKVLTENKELLYSIIFDITERNRTREALEQSEEKFRKLAELSPSGISIQTLHKFFYVNETWEKIAGYSSSEALNLPPLDVIHPDDKEMVKTRTEARLKGEKVPNRYDLRIITKSKAVKWIDISVSIIEYEGKIASLTVFNDITERNKAQEALKQSEKKFRKLAELSPSGISIQTNENFLYVNEAWQKISGFTKADALKLHPLESIHPDEKEKIRKRAERRLKGKIEPNRYELKIFTKSQKVKWIDMSITTIEYEGEIASLSVINDITERNKAEKALKESESKLKLLNAQKDKFFSIIAHDLKGPMASFQQLLEVLYEKKDTIEVDDLTRLIRQMHKSAKTTNNLLSNLLIWSRSQLNKVKIEPEPLHIKKLVSETIELMTENARSKTIEINNSISDNLIVFADRNSILTVLRNLISNAINHTPKDGNITIEATENDDKYIEVKVSDNGVGISKEIISRLFKIDEDISTLGTEKEKGSGLGLILCKDFVEKNGGKIWVESELDKGSSFYFTLKA